MLFRSTGTSGLTGTYTLSRASTVGSTTLYTSNTYVYFQSIASDPCGIDKTVLQKAFPIYVKNANEYEIQTVTGPVVGTSTYTTYTTTSSAASGGTVVISYRVSGDTRGWGDAASGIGIGQQLRLWSADNFGQDLVIAPRQGPIYYWQAPGSASSFPAAILLSTFASSSYVPHTTYGVVTSDVQRFVIAMGANPYQSGVPNTTFDPMLVRWSNQESATQWVPSTSNQAGEYRLSGGSLIVGWKLARQEILIWTDSSLYTMQYLGPPYVWGFNLLMDNISIISPNAMASANNVIYWMGTDKFYSYSGRVETLPCSLRQYVFNDINQDQAYQIQAGTNEGYNEVWWFYPGAGSTVNNKYVIYNHLERVWYYGTINRTTWLDSPLRQYPMGAFSVQNSYLGSELTESLDNNGKQSVTLLNGYTYPTNGTITIESEDISYVGHDQNDGNTLVNCTRAVNGTNVAHHTKYTAVTYKAPNQVMYHEYGVDDLSLPTAQPIEAYIQSSDFDIGDGHNFGFVWRMLPDVTFDGSNSVAPQITLTVRQIGRAHV